MTDCVRVTPTLPNPDDFMQVMDQHENESAR